ncbi:hypothetical protein I6F26_30695 [Ensifer sp. IC3342]|nr:hypothetical protein [Ensifer sp. BRP08]MCA1450876.1 hypothetical protein [Ensifer sp. IC3342]
MHGTNMYPMTTPWPDPTWVPIWIDGPNVLSSLGRLQTDALKAVLRYQIEALRFAKSRCEEDLRFLEEIWSPGHVNDTFDLWYVFWQNAFLDYYTETGRFADIGSRVAVKTAKHVHEEEKLLAGDLAAQTAM